MENVSLNIAKQYLGKYVVVTIDRPLGSRHPKYSFLYPVNYGYIDGVKAPDGEDLDAYYLGVNKPITTGEGLCVAIVHRLDDDDDKLVVVVNGFSPTDSQIMELIHFQEKSFNSQIIR